ncbi:adp-ribosylation factor-like protein [Anaeramoeba ignava]|uniref:ADP-ribosylation factor-like protein 2 n=1 Tax=Anaeramoeba ignava TaxID=1746090 RepID=A0A9Q0RF17_ANAIG|nr:adp-ribosylation factor-like protein [Anaeramoeba ignava]
MGLLTIVRKIKEKEKEMRLLMLGLDNAGKTTIIKKFLGEDISTISPTLGFNIETIEHKDYKLVFWDVGGQKTLRSYWKNYYEKTDGLIWVVDSADKRRIKDCRKELKKLLVEEKLAGASLLIFANKQDIDGSLSKLEIAKLLKIHKINGRHCEIIGCSAYNGLGLLEGIDWIVDDISSRIFANN